ncbi:MAG: RNA-binding protein [Rhizobiales bacterium PAR1]|nr:MAG: RNA-binding protein [Rhizobiales bacterium PAR1]
MANKSVFASIVGKLLPRPDAKNHAGAPAYSFTPRHKLAQLAATGTFNRTFYAEAHEQLDELMALLPDIEPAFMAKTAIYAREKGFMKDMPALLLAYLSMIQSEHFSLAFPRVVDNGKMLRNVVQVLRSGATGRKSLGTRPKRMVQRWLENASDVEIMRAAVGNDPSLADVIRMVHPKPKSAARAALYGYLIGKPYDFSALPEIAKAFESFKRNPKLRVPDVPFQMLTALPLTKEHWIAIGRKAGWHMLRMNLNTFVRHGAFEDERFTRHVAEHLRDEGAIQKAKVFPYQLMVAHAMAKDVPPIIREALQDAMEIAVGNVPAVTGRVVICPDVSGSMSSPVTGHRRGATTSVRCIDVAGLVAAAILRANREARVIPFEQKVVTIDLNPRDTVLTNAAKLASIGGGGTNCSAPLEKLVAEKAKVDLVVFVSDNESWVDTNRYTHSGTGMMQNWEKLKAWNPDAKLVCIDISPSTTTQVVERADVLNIGGFSDAVFEMIAAFVKGELSPEHWVGEIEKIALE